jgi:hypothetical protein
MVVDCVSGFIVGEAAARHGREASQNVNKRMGSERLSDHQIIR